MIITAHRSGTDAFPEQTTDGALYSLEHGADMVEADIRFCKDDIAVINHDDNTLRLYGVSLQINGITAEEFLSLKRNDGSGCGGCLFEEYLETVSGRILLHIKEGGERIGQILALCKKHGALDRIIYGVHSVEDAAEIKAYSPELRVLAFMPNPCMIEEFTPVCDYMRLWEKETWLTDGNINAVKNSGRELWIMTNNGGVGLADESTYRHCEEMGAANILVNEVVPAVNYFRK